ncbi:hypothetical protein BGAL_0555g00070 [Botrytis galanthina]|uniref:DUF6594 domain-containing protein n=1 Tax=Botrytis galanthina TaxID=278940 RepID=A0A4S8QJD8_9HELO|nr:hypothetical protein BGAL_0555g00070 [Botrytis galanthina]
MNMTDLNQPKGWSKVASFLECCDSFSIYRGFAPLHARVLLFRTIKIAALEKKLHGLDVSYATNEDTSDRLRDISQAEAMELESEREEIILSLNQELLAYEGALLIQFQKLKSFSPTPEKDHLLVYRWFCGEKLVDLEQCEWMRQPEDFISLVAAPQTDRFESFVMDNWNTWPISWFQKFLHTKDKSNNPTGKTFKFPSGFRINMFAKLLIVCMAVLILLIPVILFLTITMEPGWMAFVALAFVFLFSGTLSLLTDAGT